MAQSYQELVYTPEVRKYKIHIMINPSITQDGCNAILEKVASSIEKLSGSVKTKLVDTIVKLETAINKNYSAWYAFVIFELPADKLVALRSELAVTDGVDRSLILKADTDNKAKFETLNEKDYRKRTHEFWRENIVMENPAILKFCLSTHGRILPAHVVSGLIGKKRLTPMMRQLSKAVKQARFMGWLPLKVVYNTQELLAASAA